MSIGVATRIPHSITDKGAGGALELIALADVALYNLKTPDGTR